MSKRIVSLWFPRLASDRALRTHLLDAPFALTLREANTDRLYCLNETAQGHGLSRGMGLSDARALLPDLQTRPADPPGDTRFLHLLVRWARRYCPWVGIDGKDGLVLDITGAAHLFGGEAAMLDDLRARLARAGMSVQIGLADTRGAAWALAHFAPAAAQRIAPLDGTMAALRDLPVAALRLPRAACDVLHRLGVGTVADLAALPRATVTRRLGPEPLLRLDQALGAVPEQISPLPEPPRYVMQHRLAEPIGLTRDVMAATDLLLDQLCKRLEHKEHGARVLRLTLYRVDQGNQQVELRLARPLREPARILPLFQRGVDGIDAGFGIDHLRLEAIRVDPLPLRQITHTGEVGNDRLDDLISRLGARIGLENIIRFLPADTHIPERGFAIAPAAYSAPSGPWDLRARPLRLFAPEPIGGAGREPPRRFRWRRMALCTGHATGPERIAPEWWMADEAWHRGLRDYWRVDTREGRRLWMFYTPQNPGWFVQGEFA